MTPIAISSITLGNRYSQAATGAAYHRIGHSFRFKILRTTNHIGPLFYRRFSIEPEAPMRGGILGNGRIGRLALINGRQSAREKDLAANIEFFGRLVTGIDTARRLQLGKFGFIQRETRRLPSSPSMSKPSQRRSVRIASTYSSFDRSRSVSSMRSRKRPPCLRAHSQLWSAVRTLPTGKMPVGEGAKAGNDGHGVRL